MEHLSLHYLWTVDLLGIHYGRILFFFDMRDVYLRHNFQIGLRIFANQIYYDISIDALNIQGYIVERKNP